MSLTVPGGKPKSVIDEIRADQEAETQAQATPSVGPAAPAPKQRTIIDEIRSDQEKEAQVETPDQAYQATVGVDPKRTGKVISIAQKLGQHPAVIDENLDQAEAIAASPEPHDWEYLKETNPEAYNWFAKRHNMAVVRPDLGILGSLAHGLSNAGSIFTGLQTGNLQGRLSELSAERMADTAATGQYSQKYEQDILDLEKELSGFSKDQQEYAGNLFYETGNMLPSMTRAFVRTKSQGVSAEARQAWEQSLLTDPLAPPPSGIDVKAGPAVERGVEGAAGGMALGAAVAGPGGAAAGAARGYTVGSTIGLFEHTYQQEGGSAFRDFEKLTDKNGNRIDPRRAAQAAQVVGTINGTLEAGSDIVLGKLFLGTLGKYVGPQMSEGLMKAISKVPGGEKIAGLIASEPKVFEKMTVRQAIKEAAKHILLAEAIEVPTEMTQNAVTEVATENVQDKPLDPDMIWKKAQEVVVPTALGTLGLGLLGGAGQLAGARREMKAAEIRRDNILEFGKTLQQTETKKNAPEVLGDFVASAAKNGPAENLYIAPEAFATYFQAQGVDPDMAAEALGVKDQFNAQKDTNHKFAIPLSKWATDIVGSKHEQGLADLISTSPDQASVSEQEQRMKEIDQYAKLLQGQTQEKGIDASASPEEQAAQIGEKVGAELQAAGDKKTKAQLIEAFYRTMAQRMKSLTPEQIYNQVLSLSVQHADEILMQPNGQELFQGAEPDQLGFYSQVAREVQKMDFKQMPAKDLLGRIKNIQGIKAEELEFSGLQDFLERSDVEGAKVSKQDVMDYLAAHSVQLTQTVLGDMPRVHEKKSPRRDGAPVHVDDLEFSHSVVEPSDDEIEHEANYYLHESDFFDEEIEKWMEDEGRQELHDDLVSEFTDKNGDVDEEALNAKIDETMATQRWKDRARERAIEDLQLERRAHEMAVESVLSFRRWVAESQTGYTLEWDTNNHTADILGPDGRYITDLPRAFTHNAQGRWQIRDDAQAESALGQWLIEEGHATYDRQVREEDMHWLPTRTGVTELQGTDGSVYLDQLQDGHYDIHTHLGHTTLEATDLEAAKAEALPHLIEADVVIPNEKPVEEQKAIPATEAPSPNKPTKQSRWNSYTVDGAKNYREILLHLPAREGEDPFTYDNHWRGEQNVLMHARISDRTDAAGNKTLFVEELQSDWHQQGRERGYKGAPDSEIEKLRSERKRVEDEMEPLTKGDPRMSDLLDKYNAITAQMSELMKSQDEAVPNAPFKNTDAWAALAMKRLLHVAAQEGYAAIAWSPGEVHVERWGTDSVSWVKKKATGKFVVGPLSDMAKYGSAIIGKEFASELDAQTWLDKNATGWRERGLKIEHDADHWLVGSVEQVGGRAGGVDIETAARERGHLLERKGARVTSKEELREVLSDTLNRERNDRSLDSLTENIWKQMQTEDSGVKAPRKEGMEFFYDNLLPKKVVPALLKKLDKAAKVEVTKLEGTDQSAWEVVLTPKMKEEIQKGFSLFQQDQTGQARGSMQFNAKDAVMKLGKAKNHSTFFHEAGHFFLQLLNNLAERPDAPAQVREDMQTLRDWFGLKDGEAITREHHEKFARGFEAYVMEGKSPSERLAKAFARFRKWLVGVYRAMTQSEIAKTLNVDLSPEVRQVMDRMLATDEEIDRASRDSGYVGLDHLLPVDSAEAQRLQELQAQARETAVKILLGEQMKEISEENQVIHALRGAALVDEAKKTVMEQPIYRVMRETKQALKRYRQDAKAIATEYFKGKMPQGDVFTLQPIAELNRYTSVDEMMKAIQESPTLAQAVDQELKRLQAPDAYLKDREAIREKALESVHNERALDLLALEHELLQQKLYEKSVNEESAKNRAADKKALVQYAKAKAEEIISGSRTKDVARLQTFIGTERRTGEALARAIAKKDWQSAERLKAQQVLNHAVVIEATRAKYAVEKMKAQLAKIRGKDMEYFGTEENFRQAANLLERLGMGRSDYDPASKTESLQDWVARMNEVTNTLNIAPWLLSDEQKSLKPQDLTVQQFRDVVNAVKNIAHTSRLEGRAYALLDGADLNEIVGKMQATYEAERAGKRKKAQPITEDAGDRASGLIAKYGLSLIRVQNLLKALQGFKDSGIFTEVFDKAVEQAADHESNLMFEVHTKLAQAMDLYSPAERRTLLNEKKFYPELQGSVPKMTLLMMALNTGNEGNREKLFGSRIVGVPQSAEWNGSVVMGLLERELSAKDWKFVQSVWDTVNSLWGDVSKLHKEMTGFTPEKVQASPFSVTTAEGERIALEGGYFPLKRDPRGNNAQNIIDQAETALYEEGNPGWIATTRTGHTKERTGAQYPINTSHTVISRHLRDVVHDIAFRKVVTDLRRLTGRDEVQQMIRETHGQAGLDMVREYVAAIAAGNVNEPTKNGLSAVFETLTNELRRRTVIASLVFRVSNITQNLSNVVLYGKAVEGFTKSDAAQAFMKYGIEHWSSAVSNRQSYNDLREFVFSKSAFMRDKHENPDITLGENKGTGFGERGLSRTVVAKIAGEGMVTGALDKVADTNKNLQEFGSGLMAGTDELTSVPIWAHAYNMALDRGESEKDAIFFANSVIKNSIGSGRKYDGASVQRGNTYAKTLSMFMTFLNTELNRAYLEAGRTGALGERQVLLKLATNPRFLGFLASRLIVFNTLSTILSFKGPKDDEDKLKWWLKQSLFYYPSMLPGLRDGIDFLLNRALGLDSYGESAVKPSPIAGAAKSVERLLRAPEDQRMEALVRSASYLVPFPGQFGDVLMNLVDVVEGKMSPRPTDLVKRRPKKERR